jgi:lipopolysaccharide export system protein LptC
MTAYVPESPEPAAPGHAPASAPTAAPVPPAGNTLAEYFEVSHRPRAYRHYGRFVGVSKILLLSLAAGLLAVLVIWPRLADNDAMVPIGASTDIQLEDIESLRVKNARLTGTSADEKPYTVTFADASQTNKDSDLVLLTAPQADVVLKTGAWVVLSAPKGRYHQANRIIELDDPVELYHDSGLEVATGSITFNLETGAGAGHDPLRAQAPFGQFESQGFRIRDDSGVFLFFGPVRAILYSAPRLEQ